MISVLAVFSVLELIFCLLLGFCLIRLSVKNGFFDKEVKRLNTENQQLKALEAEKTEVITTLKTKVTQLEEQQRSAEFAKQSIHQHFENLANKILESNAQKLKSGSLIDIKNVLDPLKTKITEFEKRIEDSFNADIKERYSLGCQITKMATQTEKMINETHSLANVLRGNNKAQGAWGELILAKILECSGLENGRDYNLQQRLENNSVPDVVINLPENKHLIIDAKTSLKHYELYLNTKNKEDLDLFLKSVKAHIKNLASKEYQSSQALFNPGFVFMFIPIESAYSLVVSADPALRVFALQNKIVVTSPNSLMAMLHTVSSVWKIAEQNKNAAEIARKAGGMYDKFVLFAEELKKVGSSICQAEKSYTEAMNRLKNGNGNLIRRAESLKSMGIATNKNLSEDLLQ